MESGTGVIEAGGALWVWQPVTEFKGPPGKWFQKWWRAPRSEPKKPPSASASEHRVAPPRHAWSGTGVRHSAPHSLPATAGQQDGRRVLHFTTSQDLPGRRQTPHANKASGLQPSMTCILYQLPQETDFNLPNRKCQHLN